MANPNFVPSLSFQHIAPWAFIYEVIGNSELSTIGTPTATTPCVGANQRLRLLTRLKWILQALLRDSLSQERAEKTNYLDGENRNVLLRVLAYTCDVSGSASPDREWSTEYATLRRITLEILTTAVGLLARLRPRASEEEAVWVRKQVEEMVQAWSKKAQLSYGEAFIIKETTAFVTVSSSGSERHYPPSTNPKESQAIHTAFNELLTTSSIPSANQSGNFWMIHDWLVTQHHTNLPNNMAPDVVVLYFDASKKLRARPGYQYSVPLATYIFEEIALHVHSNYQLPPHDEIVTEDQLLGSMSRILSIEAMAFSECFSKHIYITKSRPLAVTIDRTSHNASAEQSTPPRGLDQTVNQSPVVLIPTIADHWTPNMSTQPSPSLKSLTRSVNQSPVAHTATPPMRDFIAPSTYAPWASSSTYFPSYDRAATSSVTIDDVRAYQLPEPVELPTRKQTRKDSSQLTQYQASQVRHSNTPQPTRSQFPGPIHPRMPNSSRFQTSEPMYPCISQSTHSVMPQPIHSPMLPPLTSDAPQMDHPQSIQTTHSSQAPIEFYGGLEVAEENKLWRHKDPPPPRQQQPPLDLRPLSMISDEDTQSISNVSAVGTASSRGRRGLFGRFGGSRRISVSPLPTSLEFCFSSCAKQILFWCKKNPTLIVRIQYPNKEPERFEMIVPNVPSSSQPSAQTRSIRLVAAIHNVALAVVHVEDDRWLYILRDGMFQPLVAIPDSTPAILHLALSNNGRTIAVGCGQFILCYQLNRQQTVGPWRLDHNLNFGARVVRLQKMSFSPDSRRLISAVQTEHTSQKHAVFVSVWSCADQVFRLAVQLDPVLVTVGYADDTGISAIFLTGPSDALAVQQAFLTAALSKTYPSLLPITSGMRNQHLGIADTRIDNASQCPLLAYPHLCAVRSGRNKIALVDTRTGTIDKIADFTAERKALHLRHENVILAMQRHDTVCALWRTADENLMLKTMVREGEGKWTVSTTELGLAYRQAAGMI